MNENCYPWRISGRTEDGRMAVIVDARGYIVCHAYDGAAEFIVAAANLAGPIAVKAAASSAGIVATVRMGDPAG